MSAGLENPSPSELVPSRGRGRGKGGRFGRQCPNRVAPCGVFSGRLALSFAHTHTQIHPLLTCFIYTGSSRSSTCASVEQNKPVKQPRQGQGPDVGCDRCDRCDAIMRSPICRFCVRKASNNNPPPLFPSLEPLVFLREMMDVRGRTLLLLSQPLGVSDSPGAWTCFPRW